MPKKITKQTGKKPNKRKQRNQKSYGTDYAPGFGGLVGSGLGYVAKRFTDPGSTANKALKLARRIADAVNIEYKEFYEDRSSTVAVWSGIYDTLNAIPQGDGNAERVGDSLKVQNLTLRGTIRIPTNATIGENVRVMVVWDKQNTLSAGSDLLQDTANEFTSFSTKNLNTKYQNQVLYDQVFRMIPNTEMSMQTIDIFIPVNQHTNYQPGAIFITDGALKIFVFNDISGGACSYLYKALVTYTDN